LHKRFYKFILLGLLLSFPLAYGEDDLSLISLDFSGNNKKVEANDSSEIYHNKIKQLKVIEQSLNINREEKETKKYYLFNNENKKELIPNQHRESFLKQFNVESKPVVIENFLITKPVKKQRHVKIKQRLHSRPKARVSPQHWSYAHFTDLVRMGYITNTPIFFFLGGKTFSRGDLAKITKNMVESLIKGQRVPDQDSRLKIQQLLAEFEPELKEMKVELAFGYKQIHSIKDTYIKNKSKDNTNIWGLSGSSTFGYTDEYERHDTNWNNSVVLNINRKQTALNIGFTTNEVDFSETETGLREMQFGEKTLFSLDKYSLEDEREFMNKSKKMNTVFGFTPGASYAEGLTVGNMSLEGANFTVFEENNNAFDLLVGHTQGQNADKLMAIHYSEKVKDNFTYHIQTTGAVYDENSSSGSEGKSSDILLGIGTESFFNETQFRHESSFHRTRSSHYLIASRTYKDILEFSTEFRYYDGVSFEYNSPDVYAGISGGDDVFDRGFAFEGEWQVKDGISHIFNLDSTFNGPFGDLLYAYNELAFEANFANLNLSYEREWTDLGYNQISTFRLSRDWTTSIKSTFDWSRETVDEVGSESVRISNVADVIKDILSLSMSYSTRSSDSGTDVTKQFGLNWTQSVTHFFSLQLSLADPDATTNNLELNYLYKF
jgi:hypothetical protein